MDELFAGRQSSGQAKTIYVETLGETYEPFVLGENTTRILNEDPKLLLFTLARYKFVAKMMAGRSHVLEIGCQEAWGLPLVAQTVGRVHGIDFYKPHIDSAKQRLKRLANSNMTFAYGDILDAPCDGEYDGVFALDVLEHIEPKSEHLFMANVVASIQPHGLVILGMPSIESQRYASEPSRIGHVNCKSGQDLAQFAGKFFRNVMSFCMNDEVLHTGYFPMAQYLLVVCSGPITRFA